MSMEKARWVHTPAEVAGVLRVEEEAILREIREGKLVAIEVEAEYRVTPLDLISWMGRERYLELFGYDVTGGLPPSHPVYAAAKERLLGVLGSGGLEEEEAAALADELVHQVRGEIERVPEGPAPSPEEVRRRVHERREGENETRDHRSPTACISPCPSSCWTRTWW